MSKTPPLIFPAIVPPPPPLSPPLIPWPDPIHGLLTFGTANLLAGAPHAGKTTMLISWTHAWLNNGTICGYPTSKPTAITWVVADGRSNDTRQWLDRMGIGQDAVQIYDIFDDPSFPRGKLTTTGTVHEAFQHILGKTNPPPGSLLYLDPLTPLFIAGDGNKARDVALSLMHYTDVCKRLQITMLATGHFAKQKGGKEDRYAKPQERIAGSGAFIGYSSTQVYLLDPEPESEPVWTLGWVPRMGPSCMFEYVRNEHGLFVPKPNSQTAVDALGDATAEVFQRARGAVLTALPAFPDVMSFTVLVFALSAQHGISRATAYRHRKHLEDEGLIESVGRGQLRRTVLGQLTVQANDEPGNTDPPPVGGEGVRQ